MRWTSPASHSFIVYNGVRQVGVSSPELFCIYADGLLVRLKEAKLGCLW